MNRIRNFAIIAHIDHGKSTLADRLIEIAGFVRTRGKSDLVMDDMDLERERGITIKANTARLGYKYGDEDYVINLVDTPGHVDFSYEVMRSLAACEGVLLLVDATQGVEAQTIANLYLAMEVDKVIIPVVNKIDIRNVNLERIDRQVVDLGFSEDQIIHISAKTGENVEKIFTAIIERIPEPVGAAGSPLRALVFDAKYDPFVGGVIYIRIMDGTLRKGDSVRFFQGTRKYEVNEVGYLTPQRYPVEELSTGEVGYCIAGFKSLEEIKIGDTLVHPGSLPEEPLPGCRDIRPVVFCGLYPVNGAQFENLRKALDKLHLNDTSFTYAPETSLALGFGFRCGFLGLLHMEIIQERLEREFKLELIVTSPNVKYRVHMQGGEVITVENPAKFPEPGGIELIEEPFVDLKIVTPAEYVGLILELVTDRRGIQKEMVYIDSDRVMIEYELPLAEIIFDFCDRLKSCSRGYASMDYDNIHYLCSEIVKLDILVNGEPVDALSVVVHKSKAFRYGKNLVKKLKEVIPRHLFAVPIQAAVGNRVIARETLSAMRKNVTAKCYGGDVTRKRKLLEKQKEGKKRLKSIGKIEIPQEGFLAVLKANERSD